MTGDNIRANAAAEWRRAGERLAAAEHLLQAGFPNNSITRSYFAVFHAARALLLT